MGYLIQESLAIVHRRHFAFLARKYLAINVGMMRMLSLGNWKVS